MTRAAKILGQAERPLIVVGGGALDAGPEVQAVAEALQAPVSSFRRGRGVIPTTHPLAVSFTEGHALWKNADAVLAIGTRLYWQQSVWGVDDNLPIVRLDIDPEEINRFRRPACALLGDAATVLRALLAELPAHNHARRARRGACRGARGVRRTAGAAGTADGLPARHPRRAAGRRHLRGGGDPDRLRQPAGVSGARAADIPVAGLSGHAGLGLWHGARRAGRGAGRKVVLATGDGGFMFQAAELATAMRHRLPVVVVVFDDGAFGNVRRIQEQQYGNRLIACDLTNPDFVEVRRELRHGGVPRRPRPMRWKPRCARPSR